PKVGLEDFERGKKSEDCSVALREHSSCSCRNGRQQTDPSCAGTDRQTRAEEGPASQSTACTRLDVVHLHLLLKIRLERESRPNCVGASKTSRTCRYSARLRAHRRVAACVSELRRLYLSRYRAGATDVSKFSFRAPHTGE